MKIFLFNPEESFFIRELTRKLNEQINSIRRELDNLKKIGFLKSRMKNRKKYYCVNQNFIILEELTKIFTKAISSESDLTKKISSFGNIDLLVFAGVFVNNTDSKIDILIVGNIDINELEKYFNEELKHDDLRYTIISKDEFLYRLNLNDRFIKTIIEDKSNVVTINNLKKEIKKL